MRKRPEWEFVPDESQLWHLRRHLLLPGNEPASDTPLFRDVRIVEPYDFTHKFRVNPSEAGKELQDILTERLPFRSASVWAERIREGNVYVEGNAVEPGHILSENQRVTHRNTGVIEPSVPDEVQIMAENRFFIMVNKPAPMPTHPGGRYNKNTLISVLEEMGYRNLHIVHRLDSVTSGLLILAKDPESARRFQQALAGGKVRKSYEAIVLGKPEVARIVIRRPIKRKDGYVFTCSDDEDAKSAETRFEVIESHEGWSRVRCEPVTGRTHQIRLHLKEWGHPIWDDPLYGSIEKQVTGQTLQNRGISLVNIEMRLKA